MCLAPSVCVETMDCAQLLSLFYWLQYRFIKRLKRETLQRVREEEKQNEAEHGESAIDGICTYWLIRLDPFIECCIWSSPQTVSNIQLSSLFHSAPAIPDTRYM